MDHLNKFATKFLLQVKEIPEVNKPRKTKGSIEHVPSNNLTGKIDFNPISLYINPDNSVAKIFKTVDEKRYGFEDMIYPSFIKFTTYLSSLQEFINKASERFILEETFNWVIDSFLSKKIQFELITYLQMRIEKETVSRMYHFPVLNLFIEEPFGIGNAKFQYFAKEYFDRKYDEMENPLTTKDEFDHHYKQFYGKVVVSCNATAEPRKCEELAFYEASVAMDVFRLFSPAIFIPHKVLKVDLEKRINLNYSNTYFSESKEKESRILLHFDANADPYFHKKDFHNQILKNGLETFSDFVKHSQSNDLYKLIKQSISFYSFALSISDIHLRLTQLFMLIECLLLEESYVKDLEKKSKTRFCKILFSPKSPDFNKLNSTLTLLYQVRHQFTHKGIRMPINPNRLFELQVFLVEFLKRLIGHNQNLKTKNSLIEFIDSIN